jgi:hypothetical protein
MFAPDLNTVTSQLCRVLGELHYPLYFTPYPLIYRYTAGMWRVDTASRSVCAWGSSCGVQAVGFACACLKLYEQSVRAYLSRSFLHTARPSTNATSQEPRLLLSTPES